MNDSNTDHATTAKNSSMKVNAAIDGSVSPKKQKEETTDQAEVPVLSLENLKHFDKMNAQKMDSKNNI